MPAQDRVRRDQALAAQCSGQPPDEGGEDRWVSPAQVWSWQLMIAAFLAVMFAQVGFLGHDARASAGVPFGRHNNVLGLLCANLPMRAAPIHPIHPITRR
jgi:uncharacterized membrane protein YdbT with pleckstrin-like domain